MKNRIETRDREYYGRKKQHKNLPGKGFGEVEVEDEVEVEVEKKRVGSKSEIRRSGSPQ